MVHGAEPDMGLSQRRPCSAAFWIIAESGAADGRRLEMREVSAVAGAWCEKARWEIKNVAKTHGGASD